MKQIKSFRITEVNQDRLAFLCYHLDRSEGYIINLCIEVASNRPELEVEVEEAVVKGTP